MPADTCRLTAAVQDVLAQRTLWHDVMARGIDHTFWHTQMLIWPVDNNQASKVTWNHVKI